MKKRTLISIILTILIVFITNFYWNVLKPIPVDFEISGDNNCKITAQFNLVDADEFVDIKSATIDYKNGPNPKKVKLKVKGVSSPKRFRIVLNNTKPNSTYTIKNIRLQESVELNDLDYFATYGAKLIINDDSLTLNTKANRAFLVYEDTLDLKTSRTFDFSVFVIISVLSFLLIYKLTDYLADFSNLNGKSPIDIAFLSVFCICLLIPASFINQKELSHGKKLATWHALVRPDGSVDYKFGKGFQNWFNDRFYLKNEMKTAHTKLIGVFSSTYETPKGIFNKNDKWLFIKNFGGIKSNYFTPRFVKEVSKNLKDLNKFCNQNNIKLYALIVPTQDEIYFEYGKPYLSENFVKKVNDTVASVKAEVDFPVVYPYNELKKYSDKRNLYFKTDWRWTDDGAYIGYNLLLNEIKKDFPDIKITTPDDYKITTSKKVRSDWSRKFTNGSILINQFSELDKEAESFLTEEYNYWANLNAKDLKTKVIDKPFVRDKIFEYNNGANLRVIQLGSSISENMMQFMPYSVNNMKYIRIVNVKNRTSKDEFKIMKNYKRRILDYKPDILILCITPADLIGVTNFFKE